MSEKVPMFPILNDRSIKAIPWAVIQPHERQAQRNHGQQTLNRLAQRGGLDVTEAVSVMMDQDYTRFVPAWARAKLMAMVWAYERDEATKIPAATTGGADHG